MSDDDNAAIVEERDHLRKVHGAAWGLIWALSPHAHHTLSVDSAVSKLKSACEKAQVARARSSTRDD